VSALFDLAGLAAIVWGFYLIFPCLGFIVGGLGLILLGMVIDPPAGKPKTVPEE
jgi:hypothetical protein